MNQELTWRHVLAAFAFLALGYLLCLFSPIRASLAPETASLVSRLHQATVDRARADSSLVSYRATRSRDSARVEALAASQRAQTASLRRLETDNALLAERLAQHPESVSTIVPLLGQGLAAEARACEGALSACDSAKAVLREQVVSADSAFNAERQRGVVTFHLATEATGAAVRWEAKADRFRVQRNVLGVIVGLLAVVAAVK